MSTLEDGTEYTEDYEEYGEYNEIIQDDGAVYTDSSGLVGTKGSGLVKTIVD